MEELIVKVYRGQPKMVAVDSAGEKHIISPELVNQIAESKTGITDDPNGALTLAIEKAVQEARVVNGMEPIQDGGLTPPAID